MKSKSEKLWENLKDPEFRYQFNDAHIDEGIAFQIRSLRNKKGQTQPEFAEEIGVKQPLLSAWENPNYGKYSLNTLKKLAKAFDVGLLVRFVPFSTLVDWAIDLTPDNIAPPSFYDEQKGFDLYSYFSSMVDENILSDETVDKINEPISEVKKQKVQVYAFASVVNSEEDTI